MQWNTRLFYFFYSEWLQNIPVDCRNIVCLLIFLIFSENTQFVKVVAVQLAYCFLLPSVNFGHLDFDVIAVIVW